MIKKISSKRLKKVFFLSFYSSLLAITKEGRKKLKKIIQVCSMLVLSMLVFLTSLSMTSYAESYYVLPGGETIGLKISTGVYVVGTYAVDTPNGKIKPWMDSDICENDHLLKINQQSIESNDQLLAYIKNQSDRVVQLTLDRKGQIIETSIRVVRTKEDGQSLGLYLRDKMIGVGTVTFVDPKTQRYASLGHGIYDDRVAMGEIDGTAIGVKISGLKKSVPGTAGEKLASLTGEQMGTVLKNCDTGVYGKFVNCYRDYLSKKKMKLASQDEVGLGEAKILTVTSNGTVEEYSIDICKINYQSESSTKGLKIKITDERLLQTCGGIVQGMSGSPIIQNDMIVGAVSHVIVDTPNYGYGMHIGFMYQDLQSISK